MSKDLLKELQESELEDFERPVSNKPLAPIVWSIEKYEVAQLVAIKGKNLQAVSEETTVPVSIIKRWLRHPDFVEYINKFILEYSDNLKAKRLMTLNKILDARLERAEQLGDYANLSQKDTLDVLESIRKETEKDEDKEQSNYMKTIEALVLRTKEAVMIEDKSTKE